MHRSKPKPLMDRVSKGITSDAAATTFMDPYCHATGNRGYAVHCICYETTPLPLYGEESLWPYTPLHIRLPAVRDITLCHVLGQVWSTLTSGAIHPSPA